MSNFYTDYELPIITVRTKFYPRKTTHNAFSPRPLPTARSLQKATVLAMHCLEDQRLVALGRRARIQVARVRGRKELSVAGGLRRSPYRKVKEE